MKATVAIRPKKEVLDPQGDAVRKALEKLGFSGVTQVRVGKIVEIEFADDAASGERSAMRTRLEQMSDTLLANPVMEDYTFSLEKM